MNDDTLPPSNVDAERMLLACAAELPEIFPNLSADLFYDAASRTLFEAMQALPPERRKHAEMELHRTLDKHVAIELSNALNSLPSAANWPYWREVCQEYATAREEQILKAKLGHCATSGERHELARIGQRLQELARGGVENYCRAVGSFLPEVLADLEDALNSGGKVSGLETGIERLDAALNGLEGGRFYLVAARPAVGKSSLLLQSGLNVAKAGNPALYLSLEMPAPELTLRAAQIEAQLNVGGFRRGEFTKAAFERFTNAALRVSRVPLLLSDASHELHTILGETARAVREQGVKLVLVDYVQLVRVRGHKGNRTEEVSEVSRALKRLAMELHVPIFAAAQLNRAVERESRKPGLHDLRDSGSLEQDADAVLLLHPTEHNYDDEVSITCLLAKNRSGRVGRIPMRFNRPTTRFSEGEAPAPHREDETKRRVPYAD